MVRIATLLPLVAAERYCPSADDLTVAYCGGDLPTDCPTLQDQGWTIAGGGGVATKSAFNLLGGFVEFDFDVSDVQSMVNANLYTISPQLHTTAFNKTLDYCDGAASGQDWCLEMDWIESNGACGGASTIHTIEGPGSDGCTAWGCRTEYHYGQKKFHMRIENDESGRWSVTRDGQPLDTLNPSPDDSTWTVVQSAYASKGAVLYSSQWTGWVPVDDCSQGQGSLDQSTFRVSNLVVSGTVQQGPQPRLCAGPTPTPPTPSPSPAPTPSPSPSPVPPPAPPAPPAGGKCCWGGCSADCHTDTFCDAAADQCTGNCGGTWCSSVLI